MEHTFLSYLHVLKLFDKRLASAVFGICLHRELILYWSQHTFNLLRCLLSLEDGHIFWALEVDKKNRDFENLKARGYRSSSAQCFGPWTKWMAYDLFTGLIRPCAQRLGLALSPPGSVCWVQAPARWIGPWSLDSPTWPGTHAFQSLAPEPCAAPHSQTCQD